MQHEPIGYIDSNRKQAEFANGSDIDKEPYDPQCQNVGEGCEQDLESTSTEADPNSFRYRIMKRYRKNSFSLFVSITSASSKSLQE